METYHDYVIKDGKFIGKFDEMYKKFENPWNQMDQSILFNSYSRNTSILNIRKYKIKSVLECGCGLGLFTHMLAQQTGIKVKGIDVSLTAVQKARENFPELDFEVANILEIGKFGDFEAILFSEITWYILKELKQVFEKMLSAFEGKYFLHNLCFYKGQQKYGTDYFTCLKEFIDYVPFRLIGHAKATTEDMDSIETSCLFRIEKKNS
ncbi:class I SAM-dependent methyltransferase [Candidatus Riflebacteria bacterium]